MFRDNWRNERHRGDTGRADPGEMKLAAAIIESLWGITLPLEHLAPFASQCGHACLDTLLRRGS